MSMSMSIFQFDCDTKTAINFDFLKSLCKTEVLKDAKIFQILFNINNIETKFKKEEINSNIFKEFQINYKDWSNFIYFLTHKEPLRFNDYEKDSEIVINLIEISNKFGGIPFLDNYLDNTDVKEKTYYNPQSPKEDVLDKYYWRLISLDKIEHILDGNLYSKWNSTTNILSINKGFTHLNFNFLRKSKSLGTEVKVIHTKMDKYEIIEPSDTYKVNNSDLLNETINPIINETINPIINETTNTNSFDPTFNISSFN